MRAMLALGRGKTCAQARKLRHARSHQVTNLAIVLPGRRPGPGWTRPRRYAQTKLADSLFGQHSGDVTGDVRCRTSHVCWLATEALEQGEDPGLRWDR